MADQGFATPGLEYACVKHKTLTFKVRILGSATEGSITAQVLNCPDASARVYLSSQSLTAPADVTFAGLTSAAAPSVIGFYVSVADARFLHNVAVPVATIRSASMTAGAITTKGATSAILGNTGVTTGQNIAFQISCTGANFNAGAGVQLNHEFDVQVAYSAV